MFVYEFVATRSREAKRGGTRSSGTTRSAALLLARSRQGAEPRRNVRPLWIGRPWPCSMTSGKGPLPKSEEKAATRRHALEVVQLLDHRDRGIGCHRTINDAPWATQRTIDPRAELDR